MLLNVYTTGKKGELVKSLSFYQAEPRFYIEMPSGEHAPVFDYKSFPFEIFKNAPLRKKKGKTLDRVQYYDIICTYDIEATTILNSETPYAFMYQWQICIEDYVFFGRTWDEFMDFMITLSRALELEIYADGNELHGRSLVVYVMNLSYEFQFSRFFMGELVQPMITDRYRPLLIPTSQGFTYRCAYRLTNKGLAQLTKGFPHEKLSGELDYRVIRTPGTPYFSEKFSNNDMAYCYNDVKGLSEAMRDYFDHDKYTMATVPPTATGYPRKDTRNEMNKNPQNHTTFINSKLDAHLYKLCRKAFRGGNTHCSALHAGKHLKNVSSWDIVSSYPAWIQTRTYPIGKFEKIEDTSDLIDNLKSIVKEYCILTTIRIFDFEYIGTCNVPYISRDKTLIRVCDDKNKKIIEDNGRIVKCSTFAELTVTELDLLVILQDYKIGRIEVLEAYKSVRGKLPKELRKVCYEYFKKKTELKDVPDTENEPLNTYNYNRYKALLNSTYGMMVTRIDRQEFEYKDGEYVEVKKSLQQQLDDFYNSKSAFLSYQHGCWVTAWARYVLHIACEQICGPDLVYIDTDSCKYIGDHAKEFEELNRSLIANAELNGAVATNREGKKFYCGVFEKERTYTDFKTLRSKCYIYSYDNGEHIKATISGVAKDVGAKYFTEHGFDALKDGLKIKISGKLTPYYNNDRPHYIEYNGEKIYTASNIALVPADYTIKIQPEHISYIESVQNKIKFQKEG